MLYDLIAAALRPCAWWGRMRVNGLALVPAQGPLLIVPNHDSQWDPLIVGLALLPRRRVRFLARSDLWRIPGLPPVLNSLRQIPVNRGGGDAAALDRATEALRSGDAIGVFPEGRLSWGETVRARSGVGLLAAWCPESRVVLCSIEGTTDYVRFPRRPRVVVSFLEPAGGGLQPGEDAPAFAARLLAELRARVPVTPAGRRSIVGGPPRIQRSNARLSSRS